MYKREMLINKEELIALDKMLATSNLNAKILDDKGDEWVYVHEETELIFTRVSDNEYLVTLQFYK